jgi:hypothetical protein
MAGGELAATLLSSLGVGSLTTLLLCIEISLASLDESCPLTPYPLAVDDLSVPFQDGSSHDTPVKLLTANPLRIHLRQGAPVRSRARRPALIAPWLALGPSLWPTPVTTVGLALWSMVPSSLPIVS